MEPSHGIETPDENRRLYHDLRTSLHHLVSYTLLLIEDAAAEGQEPSSRNLDRLHRLSRRLLASIIGAFETPQLARPDRSQTMQAIQKQLTLHDQRFRRSLGDIITLALALEGDARRRGSLTALKDLEKVIRASEQLRRVLNEIQALPTPDPRLRPFNPSTQARPESDFRALPHLNPASFASSRPEVPPGVADDREAQIVLVVDDSELNRDILSRRLGAQGYVVNTAENGRLALESLETTPADLVLLDVMMPEMDGFTVLQQMKATPSLRDIPVVMISALDDIESVAVCVEMGADDYLPKPFDPVLLRARVRGCLEKKRLRDRELRYLQDVARLTAAAAKVESNQYAAGGLDEVTARPDELGQLARVFERMAREVAVREEQLRAQVQELRVQIDEAEKAREVAEITDTQYFQQLQLKARAYRKRQGLSSS